MLDLFEVFYQIAMKYKEHAALNFQDKNVTYQELLTLVIKRKEFLKGQELEKNVSVAVILQNELDFIVTLLALWSLCCIPIPLDVKMKERETRSVCNNAQFTIMDGERAGEIKLVRTMNCLKEKPKANGVIFFTSGTTGTPKGVCFSSQAIYDNVMDAAEKMRIHEGDFCYTPISIMYTAVITTVLLPALFTGACMVIRKTVLPQNIIRTAGELKISIFFAVPYLFDLICSVLETEGGSFYCSKTVLSSSAYLEPALFSRFMKLTGKPVRTIYCSSEAGAVTYNDFNDVDLIRNTAGRTFQNTAVRILNQGQPAGIGQPGEIYVSGTHIAAGYWGEVMEEGDVFSGGWVRTGDLAVMTEEGGIILKGRIHDTMNVAGHMVSPEEVEAVLKSYPGIREARVYGIRKEIIGEAAAAEIVLAKDEKRVNVNDLKRYCRDKLSSYKIPVEITVVNEISLGRYGKKIRRREEV